MSPGSASTRLARLLALVPYLSARPGAPVAEVATAFGVPEEVLLDDLELLFVCGLPGHLPDDLIEASFEGGVIHVSNADTIARPLRLGVDEALALLVGLRTLGDLAALQPAGVPVPAGASTDVLERTVAKLERAAGDAAALAANVAVQVAPEDAVVPLVRAALRDRRRLHLRYYVPGRDETTERDVDPMRLLEVDDRPYLEAWCRRVEAVRIFRLDRVVALDVLDVAAEVPRAAKRRDLAAGLFQPSGDDELVTLELSPAARWVSGYYPCESVEELAGGGQRVRLYVTDPRWVTSLVLRLGGTARVLDPPELVERLRAVATEALGAYEGDVRPHA